ncbi:rhodanese-like domain-containing protein [Janibacter indicus]|uniref:rhodanese-like domain-containing protein n=1 Tax=Janibacter indicus TaxID=857417 RepID=UPI000ACF4B64
MSGVAGHHDGIDALLADARSRLSRITPTQAWREVRDGTARLVDIRPAAQRAAEGEVAGVLDPWVIERNVLEWRLDPRQQASLPGVALGDRVIVICQEGYTSSLAADSLRSIGIERATDVVGGFAAWRDLGLPVARLRAA